MGRQGPVDGEADRRRAPRAGLRLSATIREPGRSRTGVKVIDISTHGCRVEAPPAHRPDTWVMLSIAGLEAQYCRIVWRAHEFAGLEFATRSPRRCSSACCRTRASCPRQSIGDLRDIANRMHRLGTVETSKDSGTLVDLSSKCAADAVVEGLRLGETEARTTPLGDETLPSR